VSEDLPLAGVRVVVTRAERQVAGLAAAFAAAGATVEPLPLLEVVAPDDPAPLARAAAELRLYDWVVLTSANAVHALLTAARPTPPARSDPDSPPARPDDMVPARPHDMAPARPDAETPPARPAAPARAAMDAPPAASGLPPRLRVAAIGAATAAALRGRGVEPTLVAAAGEQSAAGLLATLLPHLDCGQRVLLPQAADALPTLRDGLLAAGIAAVAVAAYDKRRPETAARRAAELFSGTPIGWVTFTSPSIVRHFADLFGTRWQRRRGELRAASIGPVTSAELRRQGVEPRAEAANPTAFELVAAVAAVVGAG
jgi:uroporphyrinogen-III synthase